MNFINYLLNLSKIEKQILLFINDVTSLIFSFLITFFFFYGVNDFIKIISLSDGITIYTYLLVYIISFIPIFIFFDLYRNILRLSGLKIVFNLSFAVFTYGILCIIYVFIFPNELLNNKICIFLCLVFFIFVLSSRLLAIILIQSNLINKVDNILVVGINDQTINNYNSIFDFSVKGIIDFDESKIGRKINGIKIQNFSKIENIITSKKINKVVLSIKDLGLNDKIYKLVEKYNIGVELISDNNEILKIENNRLDEIIFASKVKNWNTKRLNNFFKDKKVLVTGAGGSIGSEISLNVIKNFPLELCLIDNSEFNLYNLIKLIENNSEYNNCTIKYHLQSVTNEKKIEEIFEKFKPDIIFHAAAYKHVNLLEFNELEAVNTNIFGTLNIVNASIKFKVPYLTLISTDKAVNPANFMGETKKFCELILQAYYNKFNYKNKMTIVRFGNVINSNGSVLPLFKKQIQNLGPLTVTDQNVTRYFMTINEASRLVLETSLLSQGCEIFALNMGEPIKIIDIAKKLINFSGYNYSLESNNRSKIHSKNQINIIFTGLRPGEKMHEEIFYGEKQVKTENNDILMSIENSLPYNEINEVIIQLKKLYNDNDVKNTRTLLKNCLSKILN